MIYHCNSRKAKIYVRRTKYWHNVTLWNRPYSPSAEIQHRIRKQSDSHGVLAFCLWPAMEVCWEAADQLFPLWIVVLVDCCSSEAWPDQKRQIADIIGGIFCPSNPEKLDSFTQTFDPKWSPGGTFPHKQQLNTTGSSPALGGDCKQTRRPYLLVHITWAKGTPGAKQGCWNAALLLTRAGLFREDY